MWMFSKTPIGFKEQFVSLAFPGLVLLIFSSPWPRSSYRNMLGWRVDLHHYIYFLHMVHLSSSKIGSTGIPVNVNEPSFPTSCLSDQLLTLNKLLLSFVILKR